MQVEKVLGDDTAPSWLYESIFPGAGGWEKCSPENKQAWRERVIKLAALLPTRSSIVEECAKVDGWMPIETAPKEGEIDIWVSGPGARRVPNCRWGNPSGSNWGDRFGNDKNLPQQWIDRMGFTLDRRNGVATHWRPLPAAPTQAPETTNGK